MTISHLTIWVGRIVVHQVVQMFHFRSIQWDYSSNSIIYLLLYNTNINIVLNVNQKSGEKIGRSRGNPLSWVCPTLPAQMLLRQRWEVYFPNSLTYQTYGVQNKVFMSTTLCMTARTISTSWSKGWYAIFKKRNLNNMN